MCYSIFQLLHHLSIKNNTKCYSSIITSNISSFQLLEGSINQGNPKPQSCHCSLDDRAGIRVIVQECTWVPSRNERETKFPIFSLELFSLLLSCL